MKYCCLFAVLVCPACAGDRSPSGGRKPDLSGGGVLAASPCGDLAPTSGVPFQLWAKLKFQENNAEQRSEMDLRCLLRRPRIMLQARPFEIVQTPNRILFVYEGGAHVWRQVWMDGRAHPKDPNPNLAGPLYRPWEGDTLVVDSTGFNDQTWLDDAGIHTPSACTD